MSTKVPGVVYPEVNQFPNGANSARTAGIATQNASVAKQTNLLKTANGGATKKKHVGKKRRLRGGADAIAVPQFNVLYNEPGGSNQTVNNNVVGTTKLGAGSVASSSFDACIGQGPSCTANVINSQKAGAKWGCYSGGKRRKTKKSRKTRKTRKTKKSRKTRKTR